MTGFAEQGSLTLSIVVPVLNERSGLANLVENLDKVAAEQVVLVDGGSDDGTYEWLQNHWQGASEQHLLLQCPTGRAAQMNQGAAVCSGDVVVFVHADTMLPESAKQEIFAARKKQYLWGRFDVSFPMNSFAMSVIAFFINLRSRLTGIATGDQAIFVDTHLFRIIEGFAELPLMEDIVISKQLKKHCNPYCSKIKVITSARRWQKNGVIKTVLRMWLYRLAFFFGVSAESLARSYNNVR